MPWYFVTANLISPVIFFFRYEGNILRCECSLRPVLHWLRAGERLSFWRFFLWQRFVIIFQKVLQVCKTSFHDHDQAQQLGHSSLPQPWIPLWEDGRLFISIIITSIHFHIAIVITIKIIGIFIVIVLIVLRWVLFVRSNWSATTLTLKEKKTLP